MRCALLSVLTIALTAGAAEDADRRSRREPGLILENGGRTGACDVLAFTADGRHLLAAGDDRVVRTWDFAASDLTPGPVLRWSVWRQNRGAIYAMALSPDKDQKYVAVGGLGLLDGTIAILERATGKVVHALLTPPSNATIWAIAFAPAGDAVAYGTIDGRVWLWRPVARDKPVRPIGQFPASPSGGLNTVRLVTFTPDGRLLAAAERGPVKRWAWDRPGAAAEDLFTPVARHKVAVSGDGKWLAVAGHERGALEVWSIEQRSRFAVPLGGPDDLAQSVALDATGRRLAVGVRTIPRDGPFVRESATRVALYDLTVPGLRPTPGPRMSYYAEAFAFHPDGRHLAVAGGNDYEVVVWDAQARRTVAEGRSAGASLWGVGLSNDGRRLGYRIGRNPVPPHPNERAAGPWTVFDLRDRAWASAAGFEPVRPISTLAGWSMEFSPNSADTWHVVGPGGRHRLPLDPHPDSFPRCYTFLPATSGRPPRLAVGHYWGWSLYDLTAAGPKRIRVYAGHMGYVTAIAPSADGSLILTASRDQTVAAWSLAEWGGHPFLGAKFVARLGRLFVDDVAPGSPAWEADLTPGDEIAQLLHLTGPDASRDRRLMFHAAGTTPNKYGLAVHQSTTSADEAVKWIDQAAPQREFLFLVKRAGQKDRRVVTHGIQRPLWVFFPTRSGEWVLWRYLDYFYDASPGGAAYVGWQVSGSPAETPAFYPAQEFDGRHTFYRPDKVDEILRPGAVRPDRVNIPGIEPPEVAITLVGAAEVGPAGVALQLTATPRGPRDIHRPKRVTLWVNDHRYRDWPGDPATKLGEQFAEKVTIPADKLPHGPSRLTIQCEGRGGATVRQQVAVTRPGPAPPRRLFALLVGVVDYGRVKMLAGRKFNSLPGVGVDLVKLEDVFKAQQAGPGNPRGPFAEVVVPSPLENDTARPGDVLAALDKIAAAARPDDLAVIYLAGHGYNATDPKGRDVAGTFVFVGPAFDERRPSETGLTTEALYARLARIACPKVVMVMACHSGDATRRTLRDPVRELTPGGVGPMVLTACAPAESALVDDLDGSLMAQALAETAETPREWTVAAVADAVRQQVPRRVSDLAAKRREKLKQTPQVYAPDPDAARRWVLFRK